MHMAAGGIMNAAWDLWARLERKPLWRMLSDMTPEQFVACVDFRYLENVISRSEALALVQANEATKAERIATLENEGYPAYTTSAGWLGYSDEQIESLVQSAIDQGFRHVKLKVGQSLVDDLRRVGLVRKCVGDDVKIMVDANQVWEVDEAVQWVNSLADMQLWFIEEPTSPDDILGHRAIKSQIAPVLVATGEQCHNRVMFKQFIAHDAIDIVQIDSCRLASVSEILAVLLMAAKYKKPVCPHAGGVGLCEMVQHLSMVDYVRISADMTDRVIEFVDHLQHNNHNGATPRDIDRTTASWVVEDPSKLPEELRCCTVCLEEIEQGQKVRTLPCLHTFHAGCAEEWLKKKKLCPLCQFSIDGDASGSAALEGSSGAP